MPTIFTHPAVPLALTGIIGRQRVPTTLLAAGMAVSVLPDADVIGFGFGVRYGDFLGHRGFFHSPFFALSLALLSLLVWQRLGPSRLAVFSVIFISGVSHGLLDALTDGGLGIALLSPVSNTRYFFPWRPIAVAPIGILDPFSREGLAVLGSEFLWVWLPCLVVSGAGICLRRWRSPGTPVSPASSNTLPPAQ